MIFMTIVPNIAIAVLITGVLAGSGQAQCNGVDPASPLRVKQEVTRIFESTLDKMTYTLPSGIRATTWSPPGDAVANEVRCFGSASVPAIAELLSSTERSFGSLLAVKMLGWAGGPEIVPPLERVLSKKGDLRVTKTAALESLTGAPPEKALPVVEKILASEHDAYLLKEAASVQERLRAQSGN